MDPSAENFDPQATADDGTCSFIAEDGQEIKGTVPEIGNYVSNMLSKVWGSANITEDSKNAFKGSGYPFSGDIVSRRDIERLVGNTFAATIHRYSPCQHPALLIVFSKTQQANFGLYAAADCPLITCWYCVVMELGKASYHPSASAAYLMLHVLSHETSTFLHW